MNTETLARTPIGKVLVRLLARAMESRFRYRFFGPREILKGVDGLQGRAVLELGCGTGFFTMPAAQLIGDDGSLVSIDILAESAEHVANKVMAAGLKNVRVVKGDALQTNLGTGAFDTVLLLGLIPAPMLPLAPLLAEVRRVLKPDGVLAVWPPVPGWLPQAVLRSGLYTLASKRNGVYNFRRR